MRIASITDKLTATGLRLAGLKETEIVENEKEAKEALNRLSEKDEIGIIVITEQLAQKINNEITNFREKKDGVIPILIEIPGREGSVEERRGVIDRLVKRAVGIKVED